MAERDKRQSIVVGGWTLFMEDDGYAFLSNEYGDTVKVSLARLENALEDLWEKTVG